MNIVPVDQIPKEIIDTPVKNLSELYSTAKRMELLCIRNNGIGLSAVQVGIPWKFFIYYTNDPKTFSYMIDCDYFPVSDEKSVSIEGCLSICDSNNNIRRFQLSRYNSIKVVGKKLVTGGDKLEIQNFEKIFDKGLESVVIQHEIDHQKNILISDIGQEIQIQEKIK